MEKGIIAGIDLSEDYTQISYIDENKNVVSVSVSEDMQPYLIPTVMFFNYEVKEWSIGIEAVNKRKVENGIFADNLIADIINSEVLEYDTFKFDADEVLANYISGLLKIIRKYCRLDVSKLVISVDKPDERLMKALSGAMERLGFSADDYRIISHSESFIYYTLNQASEIWINKVMMFDFGKKGLKYKSLFATKGRKPLVAEVSDRDISDIVNMSMITTEKRKREADKAFDEFVSDELSKSAVSAIFLVGKGFDENWFPRTMETMMGNRRIFKGYNMISKGAGYAAKEVFVAETLGDYVFSCPGRTQINVYLAVEQYEHEHHLLLSKAGDNWYQAGASVQCIVNRTDVIKLIVQWPVTHESRNIFIDISKFPKRPNKTTRLNISMAFIDDSNFVIKARDLGFGDFFEASGMEITETINLKSIR